MRPDAAKAIASLAAAIEAFSVVSPSTAARLTDELRVFLEEPSIAVPNDTRVMEAPPISGLSMTPSAVRARARRREAAAARGSEATPAVGADERQIALPFSGPTAVASGRDRGRDQRPSLSDLNLKKSERGDGGRRSGRVRLDPHAIPVACADVARLDRPELDAVVVARSWWKFAKAKEDRFRTEGAMEAEWRTWIGREDASKHPGVPRGAATPESAPAPAESGQQAIHGPHEESTELFAQHAVQEREAASPELARAASARLAAGLFRIGPRDPPEARAMSA